MKVYRLRETIWWALYDMALFVIWCLAALHWLLAQMAGRIHQLGRAWRRARSA